MKIFKKIKNLILGVCALPFVLLIRMLSPWVIVRICVFDLSRVGHVLPQFDMYMCRRKTGLYGQGNFDIFCFSKGKIANYQIKKMVERVIPIFPFAFWIDKVNKRIPGWRKHVIQEGSILNYDLVGKTSPNISFTQEELKYGRQEFKKLLASSQLETSDHHPFICFHARDSRYLSTHQPEINWDYHSYRNADINNYVPAAQKLVEKGYFAFRMGRFIAQKIKTPHPKIIDYAADSATDFLDMYLSAHCRFFIAGSDGLAFMPTVFRRPVIWIDFIPLSCINITIKEHLVIPKKLWSLKENRLLTFDEMLNTQVAKYDRAEDYQKAGIQVLNNSPEEIIDVAMEMEERLNGTWVQTQEDRELQQRFLEIIGGKSEYKFFGSIGAKFLRQHKALLGLSSESKNRVLYNV